MSENRLVVEFDAPCPEGHPAVWRTDSRDAVGVIAATTVDCDECTPEPTAPSVVVASPRPWSAPAGPLAAWARRTRSNG